MPVKEERRRRESACESGCDVNLDVNKAKAVSVRMLMHRRACSFASELQKEEALPQAEVSFSSCRV